MADDYEAKQTDLHASAGDAADERPVVEDPLVELARIVHKNKQSGSKVSTGRIGNTDYFAGLDDVSEETAPQTTQARTRIEPAFSGLSASGNLSSGAQSSESDASTIAPTSRGYEPGAQEYQAPAESTFVRSEPARQGWEPEGQSAAPADTVQTDPARDRLTHVSSLWPKDPQDFQPEARDPATEIPSGTKAFPAATAVTGQAAGVADTNDPLSELNPSVSLDLEQNLSAELEDELIGVLRQSVDDHSMGRSTPVQGSASLEDGAPEAHPSDAFPAPAVGSAVRDTASDGGVTARPAYGSTPVRPDVRVEAPAKAPEVAISTPRPDLEQSRSRDAEPDIFADVRPAGGHGHPAIDENDFMAALNVPQPGGVSGVPAAAGARDRTEPSGIDALFADLDFPDPSTRAVAPSSRQSGTGLEPEQPENEFDEPAWSAAADEPLHTGEDEGPPPPEGYDLDAVARAMQESDPSLAGAGVLPPHSRAERAAVPHSGEKSRRGLFVAGGVLAVGALGAAGFFLMDTDAVPVPSGPPPIISGLQDSLKVYPEESPSSSNDTAKLIYDRVGNENEAGPDRLVVAESPQPAELPPAPADAEGGAELIPGTPKRVRTLVVRPDGTIISDDEAATPAAQSAAVETPAAGSQPARVVTTTPVVSQDAPAETVETAVSPEPALLQDTAETDANTEPGSAETAVPAAAEPSVSAPVPSVLPRKKPDAPVQVASTQPAQADPAPAAQNDGPLDLGQSATAPAAAAPTPSGSIPSGTYIVQVTSQRSADAASDAYSSLQRRFPSILGDRNAVIVSADLGDRGVFYRARIPTGSREEADTLCQNLQGAGGDCFVRRQP